MKMGTISKSMGETMNTSRTPFLAVVPGVGFLLLATSLLAAIALAVPIAAQAADKTRTGRKFATPGRLLLAARMTVMVKPQAAPAALANPLTAPTCWK